MAKSLKMVFAVGDAKTTTLSLAEPKDGLLPCIYLGSCRRREVCIG